MDAFSYGIASMILNDVVESYIRTKDLSAGYSNQLRHRIRTLNNYCGRDLMPSECTAERLSGWLARMSDSLRPRTVATYRKNAITVLRFAADLGLCDEPLTRRIKTQRLNQLAPRAWSAADVGKLYAAAESDAFFNTFCRVAYDTGLRASDCLNLDGVSVDGWQVVEAKTGKRRLVRVYQSTADAWELSGGLKWPHCRRYFFVRAKKLVTAAGLQGTLKYLRRTHGTYLGRESLGHASESTYRESYYDPVVAGVVASLPPKISA